MKIRAFSTTLVAAGALLGLYGCSTEADIRAERVRPVGEQQLGLGPTCAVTPGTVTECTNPLGACNCTMTTTPLIASEPAKARCASAPAFDGNFVWAGVVGPGITYAGGTPKKSGDYFTWNIPSTPSGYASGTTGQYGVQLSFDIGSGTTCGDASAFAGVEVCAKGVVKNGFPVSRFIKPAAFPPDDSRKMTEQQQMIWVQMLSDYTAKNDGGAEAYNKGMCPTDGTKCAHPHFMMPIDPSKEVCRQIKWEDFQFPYWWGRANQGGYYYPDVCMTANGGKPYCAADKIPNAPGDPSNRSEEIARYYACKEMTKKIFGIGITAVDDTSTEKVTIENLDVKVKLFK